MFQKVQKKHFINHPIIERLNPKKSSSIYFFNGFDPSVNNINKNSIPSPKFFPLKLFLFLKQCEFVFLKEEISKHIYWKVPFSF